MTRKAFTLLELLLTIAVLAIVAASSIPTFWGGAKEVLEDAKKSNMCTAYQNTRTGANILISIATAKAKSISGNLDTISEDSELKKLENYANKLQEQVIQMDKEIAEIVRKEKEKIFANNYFLKEIENL